MHKIDGANHVDFQFSDGDPSIGAPGTVITEDWLNAVQGELVAVIEACGITLDKANNAQLLAACVAAATANRIMRRDASGRAQVADPSAAADIDTKGARDAAITTAVEGLTDGDAGAFTAFGYWSLSNVRARKMANGLVVFSFLATTTSASANAAICSMNAGYRPGVNLALSVHVGGGASWQAAYAEALGASSQIRLVSSPGTSGYTYLISGAYLAES